MPKVSRKRVSLLQSPAAQFTGAVIGVSGLLALGAIFFGMSDKGAIDVSGKISTTDQSTFATQVNPMSNTAASTNGGLRPSSLDPDAPKAPDPEPVAESAPSEEATTTPNTATTTESGAPREETPINSGLTPATDSAIE